jgi:chromosome segregation ATPase
MLEGLLDRLLGSTMLVESLDAAMMLAATEGGGEKRFVTRGGTVLESDGRVIAGSMAGDESGAEAGGLLQRQAEL